MCLLLVLFCTTRNGPRINPWMKNVGLTQSIARKLRYKLITMPWISGSYRLASAPELCAISHSHYEHTLQTKLSNYCLAKTIAESEALEYAKKSNLRIVTVCPSLVFGPMLQPTLNASSIFFITLLKGHSSHCHLFFNSFSSDAIVSEEKRL